MVLHGGKGTRLGLRTAAVLDEDRVLRHVFLIGGRDARRWSTPQGEEVRVCPRWASKLDSRSAGETDRNVKPSCLAPGAPLVTHKARRGATWKNRPLGIITPERTRGDALTLAVY